MLNFDVIDTGIGIQPGHLEEIFKPFTQADETFTRKYGGSGLGLTICRRLAALLGGRLTVESKLGVGSRFRLSIPTGSLEGVAMIDLPKGHAQTINVQYAESSSNKTDTPKRLSGHILLVEDGHDNQTLITYILRKAGAEVTVAENGREAVDHILEAKAKSISFDLILMDMQMPVLDGYAATREVRCGGFDGPIVALTAHAMVEDREKCYAAGCDDYVTKPITREALIAVTAKFLPQLVKH
jgi:CheY-like chemotaxis protein